MPSTEAQKRAARKWNQANSAERYDQIKILLGKGEKAPLKIHAIQQKESLTDFVKRAIRETMERDRGGAGGSEEGAGGVRAHPDLDGMFDAGEELGALVRARVRLTGEGMGAFYRRAITEALERDGGAPVALRRDAPPAAPARLDLSVLGERLGRMVAGHLPGIGEDFPTFIRRAAFEMMALDKATGHSINPEYREFLAGLGWRFGGAAGDRPPAESAGQADEPRARDGEEGEEYDEEEEENRRAVERGEYLRSDEYIFTTWRAAHDAWKSGGELPEGYFVQDGRLLDPACERVSLHPTKGRLRLGYDERYAELEARAAGGEAGGAASASDERGGRKDGNGAAKSGGILPDGKRISDLTKEDLAAMWDSPQAEEAAGGAPKPKKPLPPKKKPKEPDGDGAARREADIG